MEPGRTCWGGHRLRGLPLQPLPARLEGRDTLCHAVLDAVVIVERVVSVVEALLTEGLVQVDGSLWASFTTTPRSRTTCASAPTSSISWVRVSRSGTSEPGFMLAGAYVSSILQLSGLMLMALGASTTFWASVSTRYPAPAGRLGVVGRLCRARSRNRLLARTHGTATTKDGFVCRRCHRDPFQRTCAEPCSNVGRNDTCLGRATEAKGGCDAYGSGRGEAPGPGGFLRTWPAFSRARGRRLRRARSHLHGRIV